MKKYLSLLFVVIIALLTSCEDSEINLGEPQVLENQPVFKVDFDNETFIADYIEASIVNGKTLLKATKTSTNEVFVLQLNNDQKDVYTFAPYKNYGEILYKKEEDDTFYTSPNAYSGRIDLVTIDEANMRISGNFSFIGTRIKPLLNDAGVQVKDENDNLQYVEEIKNYTNGIFANITYSNIEAIDVNIEPETVPEVNEFSVKIADVEFVETAITVEKVTIDDVDVLKIKATIEAENREINIQIPAIVSVNGNFELVGAVTNIESDATVIYSDVSNYLPFSGDIATPSLYVFTHDTYKNKIVGKFQFSGKNDSNETLEFTEGTFTVTYTE